MWYTMYMEKITQNICLHDDVVNTDIIVESVRFSEKLNQAYNARKLSKS